MSFSEDFAHVLSEWSLFPALKYSAAIATKNRLNWNKGETLHGNGLINGPLITVWPTNYMTPSDSGLPDFDRNGSYKNPCLF